MRIQCRPLIKEPAALVLLSSYLAPLGLRGASRAIRLADAKANGFLQGTCAFVDRVGREKGGNGFFIKRGPKGPVTKILPLARI